MFMNDFFQGWAKDAMKEMVSPQPKPPEENNELVKKARLGSLTFSEERICIKLLRFKVLTRCISLLFTFVRLHAISFMDSTYS